MPKLSKEGRAQGSFTNDAEPWVDHDWSVPTDAATLRHRVLPMPDQSRYGPTLRAIADENCRSHDHPLIGTDSNSATPQTKD